MINQAPKSKRSLLYTHQSIGRGGVSIEILRTFNFFLSPFQSESFIFLETPKIVSPTPAAGGGREALDEKPKDSIEEDETNHLHSNHDKIQKRKDDYEVRFGAIKAIAKDKGGKCLSSEYKGVKKKQIGRAHV